MDVTQWQEEQPEAGVDSSLEAIRRQLEGLL